MTNEETKPCRMCRQPIRADARKCPHCHELQGAGRAFLGSPPGQIVLAFVFIIAGLLLFIFLMSRTFDIRGEPFGEHKQELKVLESRMVFRDGKNEPRVSIIGRIENSGDVRWSRPLLEVVFLDAEGAITDAEQVSGPSLIPAKATTHFSLHLERVFSEDRYHSHAVRVLSATEAWREVGD